ncbi:MAG: hypothetical protein ACI82S_002416, partial [Patiriisocius sp.]
NTQNKSAWPDIYLDYSTKKAIGVETTSASLSIKHAKALVKSSNSSVNFQSVNL